MHKLVIVSNRLPISVTKTDGQLSYHMSSGGLATAMSSLESNDKIWVGWPGIADDNLTEQDKLDIAAELAKHGCYPVHLSHEQIALFYEGYSNDTLWPLFHYFPSYVKFNEDYWRAYQEVNWLYVTATQACAADDATVWIQDYQLMLTPAMLRSRMSDVKIGFFLHIPFPSYELFRQLPESTALLEGLLGADLVGFHIYDYARHFVSSCIHILGATHENGTISYDGRPIHVDAFPIGIDYAKFSRTLREPSCKDAIAKIQKTYEGKQLILSMDRLDYSKGIMKRLDAYETFLRDHPECHGKVTMMMVAVPSRTDIKTYQQLRDAVEQTVSRINGEYGTVDWAPISYQFKNLPFEEIVALMNRSDVALVTPLRDGMNLVAKEYVASKANRTGVLILSEMTGAAEEMIGSLIVNPNDTPSLARKIHRALTMPTDEQRARLKSMRQRISRYTVQKWGSDFLQHLETAGTKSRVPVEKRLTSARIDEIIEKYDTASSRLILLDYDGTLRGFTSDISANAAKPGPHLLRQLKAIATHHQTTLCIISGRPKAMLERWFRGIPNIALVAEHGAWVKDAGEWRANAEPFETAAIAARLSEFADRTPGAIIEEKDFAVVWHYRQVSPELAYVRNFAVEHELTKLLRGTDLTIHHGNKIIEIKPRSTDKGVVARELADRHKADFILCAGDDYTDEHMFQALPHDAHTIKVGPGSTHAQYQVARLERVLSLIERLSKTE